MGNFKYILIYSKDNKVIKGYLKTKFNKQLKLETT